MRTEWIDSFVAVAEEGGFTLAAKRLFVDQTVVSKHVFALERELGVKLFARTTRTVSLTREGAAFLPHAQQMAIALNQGKIEIRKAISSSSETIFLGFCYMFIDDALFTLVDEFSKSSQPFRVDISESAADELLRQVESGVIDGALMGVTDLSFIPESLAFVPIHTSDEVILAGSDSELCSKSAIVYEDVKHARFVYPSEEPTAMLSIVKRDFEQRGHAMDITHTTFFESALRAIARGGYIMDVPAELKIEDAGIIALPYRSDCAIAVGLVFNPRNPKAGIQKFAEFLKAL